MVIMKNLDAEKGIAMIEKMLKDRKDDLPIGKTIKDFGGGYVEILKTKAKVVLYFGFDEKRNRVSITFQVKKEHILLWLEAIAEKLWNKELGSEEIVEFEIAIPIKKESTKKSKFSN